MTLLLIISLIEPAIYIWKIKKMSNISNDVTLLVSNAPDKIRYDEKEAKAILGNIPSVYGIKKDKDNNFCNESKWLSQENPADPYVEPSRYRAYLEAYLEIAERSIFSDSGIPLRGGKYVRADKGVMKVLLKKEIVKLNDNCIFELTAKGQEFLINKNILKKDTHL